LKRFLLLATVFVMAQTPFGYQKPDPNAKKSSTRLTDEEKEIIKNREMLENLDLLQNFDKFRYFDLFAQKDMKKDRNPAKPASAKKDEKTEQ